MPIINHVRQKLKYNLKTTYLKRAIPNLLFIKN